MRFDDVSVCASLLIFCRFFVLPLLLFPSLSIYSIPRQPVKKRKGENVWDEV